MNILAIKWRDKVAAKLGKYFMRKVIIDVLEIFYLCDEYCPAVEVGFLYYFFHDLTHLCNRFSHLFEQGVKDPVLWHENFHYTIQTHSEKICAKLELMNRASCIRRM